MAASVCFLSGELCRSGVSFKAPGFRGSVALYAISVQSIVVVLLHLGEEYPAGGGVTACFAKALTNVLRCY